MGNWSSAFGSGLRAGAAYTRTEAFAHGTHGSTNVIVGSLSLQAAYEMTSAGLRATVSVLETNPRTVLFRETMYLRKGQQRTVELPRKNGGSGARVSIARVGDGIRLVTSGESTG
jgi:hypothetical protein